MPTFSRPSAATLVAIIVTLAIGTQASLAASSSKNDRWDPRAVDSVEVTAADASTVTLEWPPNRFQWRVAGYGVYVDGTKVATVTPDRVHRWRDRDSLSYTVQGLTCGRSYTIGIDVFDREDDRSDVVSTTVSTAACPDRSAPSAPAGVRQVATTESAVMLAWAPCRDGGGVGECGLYGCGLKVQPVGGANQPRPSPARRRPPRRPRARPPWRRRSRTARRSRARSTGAPCTTGTPTRCRTIRARCASSSTAPRCCRRSTRRSATRRTSGSPAP